MAYEIRYGSSKLDHKQKPKQWKWIPAVILIIFVIGILTTDVEKTVLHWLLPGDPVVTVAALGHLQDNLQAGDPIGEAVTAFCREIIDGANLAQ